MICRHDLVESMVDSWNLVSATPVVTSGLDEASAFGAVAFQMSHSVAVNSSETEQREWPGLLDQFRWWLERSRILCSVRGHREVVRLGIIRRGIPDSSGLVVRCRCGRRRHFEPRIGNA